MKIKIAHILNSSTGIEVYFRTLLQYIDFNKFEIIVIYDYSNKGDFQKYNANIKEYQIDIKREINPFTDFISLKECVTILKKEKPHLIHCHSSKGGVLGRLAGIYLDIPQLYTPHAFSFLSTNSQFKKTIYKFIEKKLFGKNTYLLACSISEKKQAEKELKIKFNQLLVWANSIPPFEQTPSETTLTLPEKYICSVGRPSFQKNLEMLVEGFAKIHQQVPDLHLVLAGIGYYSPNLESIKNLISKYKIENKVILIDWTERSNIFYLIQNSIAYVSTSRYEGLPYTLIECLALKKPCIVTDCDGNNELIENNKNGFVIGLENTDDLAMKIQLLVSDENLQQSFSEQAYSLFQNKYNIEQNISKLEEIYHQYAKK